MSTRAIGITGLGAVTPGGLSAATTCSALRAGLPRMIEFEGWDDDGPAPDPEMIAGRVPLEWLDGNPLEEWPGHERWNLKPPRPHLLIEPGEERLATLAATPPGLPATGAKGCLAGGFDAPRTMGSASSDQLTGLGPAPLRAGAPG